MLGNREQKTKLKKKIINGVCKWLTFIDEFQLPFIEWYSRKKEQNKTESTKQKEQHQR